MRNRKHFVQMRIDTITGPRIVSMASRLSHGDVTAFERNRTLIIGALCRLWAFAFDHVRDDNTLSCTPDDINNIVGVDKFTDVIPPEWLQILNPDRVHLPNFLEDNGLDKVSRDNAARRKAKSRASHAQVTAKCHNVTASERRIEKGESREELRKRKITKEKENAMTVDGLDQAAMNAWLTYRAEIKKPLRPASMNAVAKKLAAMGPRQRTAVDYSIANGYQGLFEPKPGNGHGLGSKPVADHSAEWLEARAMAAAIGFRAAWPQESVGAYITSIKLEQNKRPARAIAQLAADVRQNLADKARA
jgi:hypothetical protein